MECGESPLKMNEMIHNGAFSGWRYVIISENNIYIVLPDQSVTVSQHTNDEDEWIDWQL